MESLISSKIKVKGGELLEHPGFSINCCVVSGEENIDSVRNSFRELTQFEIKDHCIYLVFEGNDEEAALKTEQMFTELIQKWTSDEYFYAVRRFYKRIAASDDEEARSDYPRYFPTVFRSNQKVIIQFLLIKEFRERLQSVIKKLTETYPNQFESNQEINLSLKLTKTFRELKESEKSLFDTIGSFTLDASSSLIKSFASNLSNFLSSKFEKISFICGVISILTRLNIDINYNDLNTLTKARFESFLDDAESQNRKFHRFLFGKSPRSIQLRYLKVLRDNVRNKFEVFTVFPFAAAKADAEVTDLMKDLVGDWEE